MNAKPRAYIVSPLLILALACSDASQKFPPKAENTPEQCQDKQDNDGDGFTDCDDQDCQALPVCKGNKDAGRKDGPAPPDMKPPADGPAKADLPPKPDLSPPDLPLPDLPPPDLQPPDAPIPPDQAVPDKAVGWCAADKDCAATKQVCDLQQSKCVDCLLDTHCPYNHQCKANKCVPWTCTPPCGGTSDTCIKGICKCGSAPACTPPKKCAGGACVECTSNAECDDGITCTNDSCTGGKCANTIQALHCLIGKSCFKAGAANPGNPCQKCDPAISSSAWTSVPCGTTVYVATKSNSGKYGGRPGLDTFCKTNMPAGLSCTKIHALISVTAVDEIRDMPSNYKYKSGSPLYWYNATTKKVTKFANSWADMLDGTIAVSRLAGTGSNTYVWTGSSHAGALANATRYHCYNWSTDQRGPSWPFGKSVSGTPYSGYGGMPTATKHWLITSSSLANKKKYGVTKCCAYASYSCPSSCPADSTVTGDILMCKGPAYLMCACEM